MVDRQVVRAIIIVLKPIEIDLLEVQYGGIKTLKHQPSREVKVLLQDQEVDIVVEPLVPAHHHRVIQDQVALTVEVEVPVVHLQDHSALVVVPVLVEEVVVQDLTDNISVNF